MQHIVLYREQKKKKKKIEDTFLSLTDVQHGAIPSLPVC